MPAINAANKGRNGLFINELPLSENRFHLKVGNGDDGEGMTKIIERNRLPVNKISPHMNDIDFFPD